jgi:hypothetical protein
MVAASTWPDLPTPTPAAAAAVAVTVASDWIVLPVAASNQTTEASPALYSQSEAAKGPIPADVSTSAPAPAPAPAPAAIQSVAPSPPRARTSRAWHLHQAAELEDARHQLSSKQRTERAASQGVNRTAERQQMDEQLVAHREALEQQGREMEAAAERARLQAQVDPTPYTLYPLP